MTTDYLEIKAIVDTSKFLEKKTSDVLQILFFPEGMRIVNAHLRQDLSDVLLSSREIDIALRCLEFGSNYSSPMLSTLFNSGD